jgi:hypothetical protein
MQKDVPGLTILVSKTLQVSSFTNVSVVFWLKKSKIASGSVCWKALVAQVPKPKPATGKRW